MPLLKGHFFDFLKKICYNIYVIRNRKGIDRKMRFFIDFEATRFSNRIISVGCVAENNNTFYSLVKPVNKAKVDKFITDLTGITNDMLAVAPSADEVFNRLFDFIELNTEGSMPEFVVYGNSDKDFLEHTVRYIQDPRASMCALAIKGNLIDFSGEVKRYFISECDLSLRKVYMKISSQEELHQNHNALEDAMMLKIVATNMYKKCSPADREDIMAIPSQSKPYPNKKKAPEIFITWNSYPKWKAPTWDGKTWMIKAKDQHSGKEKYFTDKFTACLWVIKYGGVKMSPKEEKDIEKVANNIKQSALTNKCRYNCYWEIKK